MDWQFEAVEQALLNATYWNVNLYNTLERNDGFMREDFSLIGIIPEPSGTDVADDAGEKNCEIWMWHPAVCDRCERGGAGTSAI